MAGLRAIGFVLLCVAVVAVPIRAEVRVEKVQCLNQPNCYRLSNAVVEVIVTTDVGPRIVRYAFIGGDTLLGATYPDFGSNTETYTAGTFIELETLAPLTRLGPGGSADHIERWFLFSNVDAGPSEQSLDAALGPLVVQTNLR